MSFHKLDSDQKLFDGSNPYWRSFIDGMPSG